MANNRTRRPEIDDEDNVEAAPPAGGARGLRAAARTEIPRQEGQATAGSEAQPTVEGRLARVEDLLGQLSSAVKHLLEQRPGPARDLDEAQRGEARARATDGPPLALDGGPPPRAAAPGRVHVRVRPSRGLKLEGGRVAGGGEWIEVDEAELRAPAFRAAVETEADVAEAARAALGDGRAVTAPGLSDLFDALRRMASEQLEQLKRRTKVQAAFDGEVLELREQQRAEAQGLARELLARNPQQPPVPAAAARDLAAPETTG